MGFTKQEFDNDENDEKPVEIPKDFYVADFKECNAYTKDDEMRLALIFEVDYEGETVEVGRFLSAKATTYSDKLKKESDVSDSHLGSLFERVGLLKGLEMEISARLQSVSWFDGEIPDGFLTEGEGGYSASSDNEHDLLADSVDAQLKNHKFKVLVISPDGDGGSLIEDVDALEDYDYSSNSSKSDGEDEGSDGDVITGSEDSSDSDSSGSDQPEKIFDGEDDEGKE